MGLSMKRRSALKAFFVLWGAWTVMAFALNTILPGFSFGNGAMIPGFVALFLFAIAISFWELRFRWKHLPPEARRLWHIKLVFVPVALVAWIPLFANELCEFFPGGQRTTLKYRVVTIEDGGLHGRTSLRLYYHFHNLGWGSTRMKAKKLVITNKKDSEEAWSFDERVSRVDGPSGAYPLTDDGWEKVTKAMAPKFTDVQRNHFRMIIISSMKGHFKSGPGPLDLVYASTTYGTVPIHWGMAVAGLFSLLLIPVTWLVVRFTMFPKAAPAKEHP